jgi:lysyl endopeptidase
MRLSSCHSASRYIALVVLFGGLLTQSSLAQLSFGGAPPSWEMNEKALGTVPTLTVPAQDNERLLEQANRNPVGKGVQFGQPVALVAKANQVGVWKTLADGTLLWRLRLSSPSAIHLSVFFSQFSLPKGAAFFAYTDDHQYSSGAITELSNQPDGRLYLTPLPDEAIILELAVRPESRDQVKIEVAHVVHGFRALPLAARRLQSFATSGGCHIDAACSTAAVHSDQSRSVGVILSSSGAGCTGALINNTAQDGRPLFLTADHCFDGNQGTYAVLFNYNATSCSGSEGITTQGIGGASLLSRTRTSLAQDPPFETDFMLFELFRRPPASFNAFYAGWNRATTAAGISSTYCFSHPCGDVKKYAFTSSAPVLRGLNSLGNPVSGNKYWEVDWAGNTATEPGSSGSPLFDPQGRIIGQLFGGLSYCAGPSTCRNDGATDYIPGPDWYGAVGQSWTGGGTASTRLRDYLDPSSTNVSTLTGANTPNPAPAGYCFSAAESTEDSRIDRVQLSTLNVNTGSSGCVRYTDLTANSTSLSAGMGYTLNVTKGSCGGNYPYTAKAFIDWNNDKDFDDAGETVATTAVLSGTAAISTTVTVPMSVVNGVSTVMRVVLREQLGGESSAGAVAATLACDIYPWGETEDYTINLVNAATSVEDAASGYNDPALDVFPNPATAPVTVRWRISQQAGPALVTFVDASGAVAYSSSMPYQEGSGAYELQLPASLLSSGSYSVRVLAGERQASKRLIVTR